MKHPPLGFHILQEPAPRNPIPPPTTELGIVSAPNIEVPPASHAGSSFIYVMRCEQFVKVGHSVHPPSRFSRTGFPFDITLEYFVAVPAEMAREIEPDAHKTLAEFLHRGEWFTTTVERAREAIDASVLAFDLPIRRYRATGRGKLTREIAEIVRDHKSLSP